MMAHGESERAIRKYAMRVKDFTPMIRCAFAAKSVALMAITGKIEAARHGARTRTCLSEMRALMAVSVQHAA